MSALNTEPNSEPSLPDPDIADEGSGLNEHFSRAALEEYAQAWRDFEAVQVDAPLPPMDEDLAYELADKHGDRWGSSDEMGYSFEKSAFIDLCRAIVLADRRQRAETKGALSARSGASSLDGAHRG